MSPVEAVLIFGGPIFSLGWALEAYRKRLTKGAP